MNQTDTTNEKLREAREDLPAKALSSELIRTLVRAQGGELIAAGDEQLRDAYQRVHETGRNASVTLKLKLNPAGGNKVQITGDLDVKPPKHKDSGVILYTDEYGHTYDADPNQLLLALEGKVAQLPPEPEAQEAPGDGFPVYAARNIL